MNRALIERAFVIALPVAAAAGAVVGERAPGGGPIVVAAAAAAMCVVSARARLGVLVCLVFAGGQVAMVRALDGLRMHAVMQQTERGAFVELRGTLADDPDPQRFGVTALLRAESIREGADAAVPLHRTVVLHAGRPDGGALIAAEAGDAIRLEGRLAPLRGYDVRFRWNHAVAQLRDARVEALGDPSALAAIANTMRAPIMAGLRALPADDAALLDGFVLGDTRAIDDTTKHAFRAAGLTHLLAVSGANVAFVLALAEPLLRRLGYRGRFVGGLAVVVVFAAMTRFEPSVLRASAMAAIVMLARVVGRPAASLRALAYAVAALLLIDPFLVHSVGFGLSVGACAGIVLVGPAIRQRVRGPRVFAEAFATSVAAQIGVLPVLVASGLGVAAVAPFANVAAVPLAEPVTVVAMPAAAIGAVVPPLGGVVLTVVRPLLAWVRFVATTAATVPTMWSVGALAAIAAGVVVRGHR